MANAGVGKLQTGGPKIVPRGLGQKDGALGDSLVGVKAYCGICRKHVSKSVKNAPSITTNWMS